MIRKPTEKDFREGTAITVLRGTGRTAVETRKGLGRGLGGIARLWLYGVFWFGAVTTALTGMANGHILQALVFLAILYGLQQLLRLAFKKSLPYLAGGRPLAPELISPNDILAEARGRQQSVAFAGRNRQSGEYKLSIPVSMRQASALALPGLVLLIISPMLGIISLIPGIALVGTAALIVLKTLSNRELLSFDHRSIKVCTLLSEGQLYWANVGTLETRVFSRFNIKALVTLGTRRTIALTGRDERGEPTQLLIPVDLLDLDKDELTALVADLLCCRAAAGEAIPACQSQTSAAPQQEPTPVSDPAESFDPDAILARYIVERTQTITDMRPDLNTLPKARTFGRKMV